MGFFKKIGDAVKKGVKQISLKNLVKVGTPLLSAIPIVGGTAQNVVENLSAAHEAKKQAQIAEEQGKQAEAQAYQQQADYLASLSGAQVGQQAGTLLNAFSKGAVTEAKAQVSAGAKETVGLVGAGVVDSTLAEWFKLHWLKLVLGVTALIGGLYLLLRKKETTSKFRKK